MIRRAVVGAALVAISLASFVVPARAQTPSLNVTLTDNAQIVKPNTSKHYVATLTNTGTESVSGVLVVTVPSYATPRSADTDAVKGADVSWTVTVAPGDHVTRELDADIGRIPSAERFVTTLASFYLDGVTTGPPTVRTADADRLPGVPDPRTTASPTATSPAHLHWAWVLIVGGGAALVVAGAWAAMTRRRRRRRKGSV